MRQLPASVRAYILGVMLISGLVLLLHFPSAARTALSHLTLVFAAALAIIIATNYRIPISDDKAVTVTVGISFATILLLGGALATWITAVGVLIASMYLSFYRKRWKWYTGVFNAGTYALSVALAAVVYRRLGPVKPELVSWPAVISVTTAGAVYFAVNSALVAGVVALRRHQPAWPCWTGIAQEIAAEYAALIGLSVIAAAAYQHAPRALPLLAIPLIVLYYLLKKHQAPPALSP